MGKTERMEIDKEGKGERKKERQRGLLGEREREMRGYKTRHILPLINDKTKRGLDSNFSQSRIEFFFFSSDPLRNNQLK